MTEEQTEFRAGLSAYIGEHIGGPELTTAQLDYVFSRVWARYAVMGWDFPELVQYTRRQMLLPEISAFVRHAKREYAA